MTSSGAPGAVPPPLPLDRNDRIVHDVVVDVAPGVRRIVAANPGPFTFTGTSTWLVGEREVCVIDPGPQLVPHLEAVLASVRARGGEVTSIVCTHTHADHSPGAAELRRRTGAVTSAFGPHPSREGDGKLPKEAADRVFSPERVLGDGDHVRGDGWQLNALHTPGHIANHLCLELAGTGITFTGDHVMGWSTSVISPVDGDLQDYYDSIAKLVARPARVFLSAHGPVIRNPHAYAEALAALVHDGVGDVAAIVERLYVGLDKRLVKAAQATVLSHLQRMVRMETARSEPAEDGHRFVPA
jgi:glyoxylase-like metal-dependent hydrolase (beta-lactamase superfamily II)